MKKIHFLFLWDNKMGRASSPRETATRACRCQCHCHRTTGAGRGLRGGWRAGVRRVPVTPWCPAPVRLTLCYPGSSLVDSLLDVCSRTPRPLAHRMAHRSLGILINSTPTRQRSCSCIWRASMTASMLMMPMILCTRCGWLTHQGRVTLTCFKAIVWSDDDGLVLKGCQAIIMWNKQCWLIVNQTPWNRFQWNF